MGVRGPGMGLKGPWMGLRWPRMGVDGGMWPGMRSGGRKSVWRTTAGIRGFICRSLSTN